MVAGDNLSVTKLPGFHSDMIMLDLMHSLHLGTLPIAIASSFIVLLSADAWEGPTHGPWTTRWARQMEIAWGEFRLFMREHGLRSSQPKFLVSRLGLAGVKSNAPLWKGKAADNMKVCRFLLAKYLSMRSVDPSHRTITTCLWGWVRAVDVLQSAGLFLTHAECGCLEEARKCALQAHAILANSSAQNGSQLWRTIPKHHYCDHLLTTDWPSPQPFPLNPAHGWCFADEDFIGRVCRIASRRTRMLTFIRKYILRLNMLLDNRSDTMPAL